MSANGTRGHVLHMRSSGSLLGAENVVLALMRNSAQFGFSSTLVVPVDAGDPTPQLARVAKEEGMDVATVPCTSPYSLRAVRDIRAVIADRQPTAIHTHGYREDFYALAARPDARLVATNHLWKRTTAKLRLYAALDARMLRRFDMIVAVSREILDDMRSRNLPPERLHYIPNGIDPSRYADAEDTLGVRAEFGIPDDACLIGTVASLSPEKGHLVALEALGTLVARGMSCVWLVVGDGPAREQIRAHADAAGLGEHVRLAGTRSEIPSILAALDVFLLPSYKEGLPIALLEAMASRKPIVASAVGDVATALDDGACGWLVPAGDAGAIARALEEAMRDGTEQSRAALAEARARDVYSASAMTERYCALYSAA